MESLVICHPGMKELVDGQFEDFSFLDSTLTLSLMDTGSISFKTIKNRDDLVLVRKIAFSMNYRDRAMLMSLHNECMKGNGTDQLIFSPFGSEFVGEVEAVGKKVPHLKIGDRVIGDNSFPFRNVKIAPGIPTNYASQRSQVFHHACLIKAPIQVSDEAAAGLSIGLQTASAMLRKCNPGKNENVLVTAATSNTSLFIIQVLRETGSNIVAITSREDTKEQLRRLGVNKFVCNPISQREEFMAEMAAIGGLDVVADVFSDLYLPYLLPYVNQNGRYITCGVFKQHGAMEGSVKPHYIPHATILASLITKNISLIGNCLGSHSDLTSCLEDVASNKIQVVIDRVFTGNDIRPFMNRSFLDRQRFGKVIYKYEK